jgi:hypothetical protein
MVMARLVTKGKFKMAPGRTRCTHRQTYLGICSWYYYDFLTCKYPRRPWCLCLETSSFFFVCFILPVGNPGVAGALWTPPLPSGIEAATGLVW